MKHKVQEDKKDIVKLISTNRLDTNLFEKILEIGKDIEDY